jgi:hypothetical protein
VPETEDQVGKQSKRRRGLPRTIKVLLGIVFLVVATVWWRGRIVSDVPVFSPPEWPFLEGEVELMTFTGRDELLIRAYRDPLPLTKSDYYPQVVPRMQEEAGPILERAQEIYQSSIEFRRQRLAHLALPEGVTTREQLEESYVYKYDPKTTNLSPVSANLWDVAKGDVSWVLGRQTDPLFYCYKGTLLYRLQAERRWGPKTPAEGAVIQNAVYSPRGLVTEPIPGHDPTLRANGNTSVQPELRPRQCQYSLLRAILSSDEELRSPIPPMAFMSTYSPESGRQHYHQALSFDDMKWLGSAVRIPMVTKRKLSDARPGNDLLDGFGWSVDQRFVVYVGAVSLVVVHVSPEEDKN